MYLKSIEVHGFKSFANKIVFQFHNGITGIVGPNGSGKSNVADAVRWVLGEQRAKQLRGGSMQEIIFAGTENRKPLGYAYVAITLDNSDHQLPISYDEVTVARRLYRSGESEYLMNGVSCRLKDINELFYDTGIGKEGYSIIGQGQIDKILSGKPEERRELFDEAVGIVKFKRRKQTAQKKLENEQQSLVRVNDILSELSKQIGPLERQAEKAKVYLKKREELKQYDIDLFLQEYLEIKDRLEQLQKNLDISTADLEDNRKEYEKIRLEYDQITEQLEENDRQLLSWNEKMSQDRLHKQQLENQIELLKEQINTAKQTDAYYLSRMEALDSEKEKIQGEIDTMNHQYDDSDEALRIKQEAYTEQENQHAALQKEIQECEQKIDECSQQLLKLLEERNAIHGNRQRLDAMAEQMNIRRAQLSQQVLTFKSEEADRQNTLDAYLEDFDRIREKIQELDDRSAEKGNELSQIQELLTDVSQKLERVQQEYNREYSRLESLKNLTERYDGYGNSIRKVMEQKDREKGILGVVADLIKTDKQYEVAVETALGGSIQNIVTEDEETAKRMIEHLKRNRFGRATFLPLTAMKQKGGFNQEAALKEKGVIGLASTLVQADQKYSGLVEHLLGRTLVMDHIDHAVAAARKYHYSLRIVTLEGESLSPGGSMTGGAFKNSSNLLGRRREIEELEKVVASKKEEMKKLQDSIDKNRGKRNQIREQIVALKDELQKQYLEQNTVSMQLKEIENRKKESEQDYEKTRKEGEDIASQLNDIRKESTAIEQELISSSEAEQQIKQQGQELAARLEELRSQAAAADQERQNMLLAITAAKQELEFGQQNLQRLEDDLERNRQEREDLAKNRKEAADQIQDKEQQITETETTISLAADEEQKNTQQIHLLMQEKDDLNKRQKGFFETREALSERISNLDRDVFRLSGQKEKLEETKESRIAYMWEEYELTYNMALEQKREDAGSISSLKKMITDLKAEIKGLGNVNVNAIEDFKEVSERFTFLSQQHEDLIRAEAELRKIIDELDAGMRSQFREQFARIQTEFDKTFKQLFGGGKGTLELVEDEDILEAGIRIIAQPPGKKLQNMMQLSGGEKSLTAIALLFAIQNLKPSPFCLLDEIEAALDESNVERYAGYLHKLTKHTQFIIITHRRGTMAAADRLYGITMQEKGVSALVSVNMIEESLDQ